MYTAIELFNMGIHICYRFLFKCMFLDINRKLFVLWIKCMNTEETNLRNKMIGFFVQCL
jgi:hypothetical protein